MAKPNKKKNEKQAPSTASNPRLVCLDIHQIEQYERNPRTVRNPEYERIKQSVSSQGIEQPLIVTRRPGEETYIVKAGGNTRLKILKELHAATGDPRYSMADCIEVGWDDESSVLLGHLRENNLRGDLTFVDQAVAVWTYGEMLAEETHQSDVTIADLQEALRDNGLPFSRGTLSRMRYTAKVLMPVMPVALSDGLGHRQIGEISRLHRNACQFWTRRGIGNADEFDAAFAELCRRHDGPDWLLEPLQRAVENEIAEAGDISVQTVRMAMDHSRFAALPTPDQIELATALSLDSDDVSEPHDEAVQPYQLEIESSSDHENSGLTLSVGLDGDGDRDAENEQTERPLLELRQRAHRLAHALAQSFKLDALVVPLTDWGNGFLVADLPDAKTVKQLDEGGRAMVGTLWWQLMAFSETACAPLSIVRDHLSVDSALLEILDGRNVALLVDRVEFIGAAELADRFWARLPNKEWQDWLYLAHTYREIRRHRVKLEQPLWPSEK